MTGSPSSLPPKRKRFIFKLVFFKYLKQIGRKIPITLLQFNLLKFVLILSLIYILSFQTKIDSVPLKNLLLPLCLFGGILLCDLFKQVITFAHRKDLQAENSSVSWVSFINAYASYPLLVTLLYLNQAPFDLILIWGLAAIEGLSLGLRAFGRGPHRTRLKTTLSDLTMFVLLGHLFQWEGTLFKSNSIYLLLGLHFVLSTLIVFYQCRLLQKRFIADALSFLNFTCGVISIYFASQQAFETSLLYLLLGAAFDGFDGAAARKFGGTRFGVYSDDIADGMNYGIAPGCALYFLLGQNEGLIIGSFYAGFTLSRLIFFTLNKDESDPDYFAGIPSPVGGMIVMCSIVLFSEQPTWVTFLVGIACTQMVSFSTSYRHLGRALSSKKKRIRFGAPLYLFIFTLGCVFGGVKGAASIVLVSACGYGFLPSTLSFLHVLGLLPSSSNREEE